MTTNVNPIALGVAAEGIDDLLTMVGVDTSEREPAGDPDMDLEPRENIKETIARAAVRTYLEAQEQVDRDGFHLPGTTASVRVRPQHHPHSWHQVTVQHVGGGQQPYADTRDVYEVTFTGGTPANTPGVELPHATHPPFNRELHEGGPGHTITRFPPKTIEELEAEHYDRIKNMIRALVYGGWDADCTGGAAETRSMGQTYLERFEHVGGSTFENTYRVTIVKPNMS